MFLQGDRSTKNLQININLFKTPLMIAALMSGCVNEIRFNWIPMANDLGSIQNDTLIYQMGEECSTM